jgi:hypothetical protein
MMMAALEALLHLRGHGEKGNRGGLREGQSRCKMGTRGGLRAHESLLSPDAAAAARCSLLIS